MAFKILKIKNHADLTLKRNFFDSIFKGFRKNNKVETYYAEKIDDDTSQFLFYLEDQKITGTIRSGTHSSEPFSQYVRLYCHKNIGFLELINESYTNDILSHVKNEYNLDLLTIKLGNNNFLNIFNSYDGLNIKQIEFIDDTNCSVPSEVNSAYFDEGLELDYVLEKYRVHIHFSSFEIQNKSLLSLYKNGKMNVKIPENLNLEDTFIHISTHIGELRYDY